MSFPEMVRFKAEHGIVEAVARAAQRDRTSSAEYLRHAVRAKLTEDGVDLPPVTAPSRSNV